MERERKFVKLNLIVQDDIILGLQRFIEINHEVNDRKGEKLTLEQAAVSVLYAGLEAISNNRKES